MLEEEDLLFDERLDDPMIWSASGIKTVHSCGKQWWFRYRTDIKGIQTPYLAFGKAVHKVIELIHQNNDWTDEFWQETWNDEWYNHSKDVDFTGYYKGKFTNTGSKMILNYVKKNKGVELLELESAFPNGEEVYKIGPFVTRGVIDQVRRMDGGRLLVVDLKTSKYPPDPLILRVDPQFTIYWKTVREKYHEDPLLALYHLESGTMFYTERNDNDVLMVEEMIREGQAKVDAGMFVRNIGSTCRYCPFIKQCLGEYESTNNRGT